MASTFVTAAKALAAAASIAGTTTAFTLAAGSHSGSRERQVKVYVPDGLSGAAPMVMALHGCQQTHDDVLADWGLTAAADRYGFILVAPFITSYDGLRNTNCWGFWLDQHRHEGRGEPEDLHRIGLEVERRFAVNPARRYITGLSSGGAMSVVAATTHNEYWAAAASASGLPYGEDAASVSFSGCPGSATFHASSRVASDMRAELNDAYAIPLLALQNERDCTVLATAARNLRDAQLLVFNDAAHNTQDKARAQSSDCTPVFGADAYACQHVRYTADGTPATRSRVETVIYSGPIATPDPQDTDHGHYWIGGSAGRDGKWSLRNGPSYPDIVWDFFARHPRDGAAPPPGLPRITLVGDNPLRVVRGQAFIDPGATATDREDGALPVSADCSAVDINRTGTYSCSYRATDSDGNVATTTRAVIVADSSPPRVCNAVAAAPAAHVSAARAVIGGTFGLRALANGDRADIGFAWDWISRVTLYEREAGRWVVTRPAGCG